MIFTTGNYGVSIEFDLKYTVMIQKYKK